MGMTSISVIMTVFVLNLHHRSPNTQRVPRWLRACFLRTTRLTSAGPVQNRRSSLNFTDEIYPASEEQRQFVRSVPPLKLTLENLAQELKDELENCSSDYVEQSPAPNSADTVVPDPPDYATVTLNAEQRRAYTNSMRYQVTRTNEEILHALKKIIERYEKDDNTEAIIYEWRLVALGVDRILFWIFLVGTLSSTIIVLIVAPITQMF